MRIYGEVPSEHRSSSTRSEDIVISSQLDTGLYRARLEVMDSSSKTSEETWFKITNPPLSVQFLGGSFRNISTENDLLTLYAEVHNYHSNSSYQLKWNCSTPSDDGTWEASCFQPHYEKPLQSASRCETVAEPSYIPPSLRNVFKLLLSREERESQIGKGDETDEEDEFVWAFIRFFEKAKKGSKIDALKSLFSDFFGNGTADVANLHKTLANETARTNFIQSITGDESDSTPAPQPAPSAFHFWNVLLLVGSILPHWGPAMGKEWNGGALTYTETITIPRSAFREGVTLLRFGVSVLSGAETAVAYQTLVLSDRSNDSVGILQLMGSQVPFGATERAVFESDCHTCSEVDLKNLEYEWQLGEIVQSAEGEVDWSGYLRKKAHYNGVDFPKTVKTNKSMNVYPKEISSKSDKLKRNIYGNIQDVFVDNSFFKKSFEEKWKHRMKASLLKSFRSEEESLDNLQTYLEGLCPERLYKYSLFKTRGNSLYKDFTSKHPFYSEWVGTNKIEGQTLPSYIPSHASHSFYPRIHRDTSVSPLFPRFPPSPSFPWQTEVLLLDGEMGVKGILNGPVCSQLVLVVEELLNARIKFAQERRRDGEGEAMENGSLSPAGKSPEKRCNEESCSPNKRLLSFFTPSSMSLPSSSYVYLPPPSGAAFLQLQRNITKERVRRQSPSILSLLQRRSPRHSSLPHLFQLSSKYSTTNFVSRSSRLNHVEGGSRGGGFRRRYRKGRTKRSVVPENTVISLLPTNGGSDTGSQNSRTHFPLSSNEAEVNRETMHPKDDKWSKKKVGNREGFAATKKPREFLRSKMFVTQNRRFTKFQRRPNRTGKKVEILTTSQSDPEFALPDHTTGTRSVPGENKERDGMNVQNLNVRDLVRITSTGMNKPVLVLYPKLLNENGRYLLTLRTLNRANNKTGEASQVLAFSNQPFLKECSFNEVEKTTYRSGCLVVGGMYFPIKLMYSYHFSDHEQGTIFYFGSLPWIEFTLPSGFQSNNYSVYITIRAVDSVGYVSKPFKGNDVRVEPRYKTTQGAYSLFLDICKLTSAENPAIELQQIRSLAWELNIMPPKVMLRVLDDILAMLFYKDECETSVQILSSLYSLESFGFKSLNSLNNDNRLQITFKQRFLAILDDWAADRDIFIRSNLLKSCARDQVVLKASQIQARDEVEIMMIITALTVIVDAPEYISWLTFSRVIDTMLDAKKHHMWFWDMQSEVRGKVAEAYFVLTSAVINKEYELFDCQYVSYDIVSTIIDSLFDVMAKEITSRLLEEEPLSYKSDYMQFDGYLAKSSELNVWSNHLPFYFDNKHNSPFMPGIHTIMGLLHYQSPYANSSVAINSYVLNLKLSWRSLTTKDLLVFLPRSPIVTVNNYDFRKKGFLNNDRFSVYTFDVRTEDIHKTLFVTLQITKIYTPVSAIVMICRDMQSLEEPLFRQDLDSPSVTAKMMIPPKLLQPGSYLLVTIEKTIYENLWTRSAKNRKRSCSSSGVDFLLGVWWSECFVWQEDAWLKGPCHPLNSSSWQSTTCSCSSFSMIYGAVADPLLTEADQVTVNELMLVPTFVALYFMALLLVVYTLVFTFLYKKETRLTKRRNVWLQDNHPRHDNAYLLTITTGNQRHAGTTSTVFAILNGTQAMSKTLELQSQTGSFLFSRGTVCSFIITSPVSLGDILSVQLWHDDYAEGNGWFVCEVSVADLQTGSRFVYPCYKWLSVASEDAQVVREVALEKQTTFLQDFENFLPQNIGEHTLWYSVFATSNSKFFKLQTLTIFIIVCLLLGTFSLNVVRRINSTHTMMTPDPHIETLFGGIMIAFVVLPVQWLLKLVFKASNVLEERVFYNRIVRTMQTQSTLEKKNGELKRKKKFYIDNESEFFDPKSDFWHTMNTFAHSFGQIDVSESHVHPNFAKLVRESNENELRQRKRTIDCASNETCISSLLKDDSQRGSSSSNIHIEGTKNERDGDDSRDKHKEKFNIAKKLGFGKFKEKYKDFFISAMISLTVGWMISLAAIAVCITSLVTKGSGMPKDYASLWIQTVFIAVCASSLLIQPMVITLFTFYKVCEYRFFDWKGVTSYWRAVSLDQAYTVWNYHKRELLLKTEQSDDDETKDTEELKKINRERYLRFAHPPPEHVLLHHRNQFIIHTKISTLLRKSFFYFLFLGLLINIICCLRFQEHSQLNEALRNSASNGSCIDRDSPLYKAFSNITIRRDWWDWIHSEFLDITFNRDNLYSDFNLFCDSESIIIGLPRIRMFEVKAEPCDSDDVLVSNNQTMSEICNLKGCYPNYKDPTNRLHGFSYNEDLLYKWDAHFLSVIHGYFSSYSYTSATNILPKRRLDATLHLLLLESREQLKIHQLPRAIATELTVFHPQTKLYSYIEFVAEFPATSGAKTFISVASTIINTEKSSFIYAFKHGNLILVAIAMYFLRKSCVHLYWNRGWRTIWSFLDFCLTVLCWSYVVCLMLRVYIAEDLSREMKVTYYEQFVNIKGLATWDHVLATITGLLMTVHLIRFLEILNFAQRFKIYNAILYEGTRDSLKISFVCLYLVLLCGYLGFWWFGTFTYAFSTVTGSCLTVLKSFVFRGSFYSNFEDYSSSQMVFAYIFFILVFILLFFIFGIYKAIFIYAKKHYVSSSTNNDITCTYITQYFKKKWQTLINLIKTRKVTDISDTITKTHSCNLYLTELESLVNTLGNKLDALQKTMEDRIEDRIDDFVTRNDGQKTVEDFSHCESDSNDDAMSLSSSSGREDIIDTDNPIDVDKGKEQLAVNMRALDDILSCTSEMNPSTVFLLSEFLKKQNETEQGQPIKNQQHILKFLNDVASLPTTQHHGKYGKSETKLKYGKKHQTNFSSSGRSVVIPDSEITSAQTLAEEQGGNSKDKERYFSRVPIPFEGMDELLTQFKLKKD